MGRFSRLLVTIDGWGRVRAWSRHGTSLTTHLGGLLAPFGHAPRDSVFDGELVALDDRSEGPVQDYAAVRRAVFTGDQAAGARLRYVTFDLLQLGGDDLRRQPWQHRDEQLRDALPAAERLRPIQSFPASPAAHSDVVRLGFEGSVLKRPRSLYRPGRNSAWLKHKARHTVCGRLLAVRQDHDGRWHALCDVDRRRVTALAGAGAREHVGKSVTLVYSRVDADGGLRETRLAPDSVPMRSETDAR